MSRSRARGTRRRRDTEPPSRVILVGLASFLVFAVFVYVAVSAGNGVPLRDYGTLYATVPQVGNLGKHDPVRIAGVRVGQVVRATALSDGARLQLQLDPGIRVPANTTVAVRGNGLLGARYVQLIVGSADADIADGGSVSGGRDAYTLGVPETLDTFDTETRGSLGSLTRELSTGTVGRGDALNDAIRASAPVVPRVALLVDRVLRRPGAARRLLPALNGAAAALDAQAGTLGRLFAPASRALAPLVTERSAVRASLDAAPEALGSARAGLDEGRNLLVATHALSDAARGTLPPAPAALRATVSLLRASPEPLRRAGALLDTARPAIPAALRMTSALSPVLKPLDEALRTVAPMAVKVGRHKCDIVNFGTVFRSVTGFGGTGEGPNGAAMEFRLQLAAPLPTEATGIADTTGLTHRGSYSRPCQYPPTEYPVVNPRTLGRSAGR